MDICGRYEIDSIFILDVPDFEEFECLSKSRMPVGKLKYFLASCAHLDASRNSLLELLGHRNLHDHLSFIVSHSSRFHSSLNNSFSKAGRRRGHFSHFLNLASLELEHCPVGGGVWAHVLVRVFKGVV